MLQSRGRRGGWWHRSSLRLTDGGRQSRSRWHRIHGPLRCSRSYTTLGPTMPLTVPVPVARFDIAMEDGPKVYVRRHGNPNGTRLLMSHGNGFAIDAYLPFWQRFLADYDVVIF